MQCGTRALRSRTIYIEWGGRTDEVGAEVSIVNPDPCIPVEIIIYLDVYDVWLPKGRNTNSADHP